MSTDNEYKARYAVQVLGAYTFLTLLAGHVSLNFLLALGIFITYELWNMFWINLLVKSPNIYSIHVQTTVMPDWIQVSIPSSDAIKIRKDRVVTSISELSGIRGAHMMVALRVMTAVVATLIIVAIQADLHQRGTFFLDIKSGTDMGPVFLLIMAFGQFLTGHFELNSMDNLHSSGHYLGVLGILTGSFCIGFVLKWNAFSMALIVAQFITCTGWFLYCEKIPKKCNDLSIVTSRSKICVGIELFMFQITNLIIALTVYASGANEGNILASPFI